MLWISSPNISNILLLLGLPSKLYADTNTPWSSTSFNSLNGNSFLPFSTLSIHVFSKVLTILGVSFNNNNDDEDNNDDGDNNDEDNNDDDNDDDDDDDKDNDNNSNNNEDDNDDD